MASVIYDCSEKEGMPRRKALAVVTGVSSRRAAVFVCRDAACAELVDSLCIGSARGSTRLHAPPQAIAAATAAAEAAAGTGTASSSLEVAAAEGSAGSPASLGPAAAGGRVLYAQTDSVFVHFPRSVQA
jgi:hypothetical protein